MTILYAMFWLAIAILTLAVFIGLAFGFTDSQLDARAARIHAETGHDARDSHCIKYAGDFAGIDLNAECKFCRSE